MPGLYNRAGIMTPPALKGFLLGGRTIITATGANSYNAPRYAKFLLFQLQGAGGGGAHCNNSSAAQIVIGTGGTSGGYQELYSLPFTGAWSISIGTGGSGATGANGGTTSITAPTVNNSSVGTYICAIAGIGGGGGGGIASAATPAFATPTNGAASSGLFGFGINGHCAYEGYRHSGTVARSGRGADSYFGAGGIAVIAHGVGNNGGIGAGGSSGMSVNAAGAVNGGNGGNGLCIIWEYY